MQVICNRTGSKHCEKNTKQWNCSHYKRHAQHSGCDYSYCYFSGRRIKVKCIPYQEERKAVEALIGNEE
jgi:hypothetical protein